MRASKIVSVYVSFYRCTKTSFELATYGCLLFIDALIFIKWKLEPYMMLLRHLPAALDNKLKMLLKYL